MQKRYFIVDSMHFAQHVPAKLLGNREDACCAGYAYLLSATTRYELVHVALKNAKQGWAPATVQGGDGRRVFLVILDAIVPTLLWKLMDTTFEPGNVKFYKTIEAAVEDMKGHLLHLEQVQNGLESTIVGPKPRTHRTRKKATA